MIGWTQAAGVVIEAASFLKQQPRDWQITALRTSIYRFFYLMVLPYLSIYVLALGATGTQLGMVNSTGMIGAALAGPFIGWWIDRVGNKRIYLFGVVLLGGSFFIYGVAQSWPTLIWATLTFWLGFTVSIHCCAVVCGNSLASADRTTAMSYCESFAHGLLGMLGPLLGAYLVTAFGGMNAEGIRPLFFIAVAGMAGTFFLILTQLTDRQWRITGEDRPGVILGISQVFRRGKNLKRFMIISSITYMPQGMVIPFTQVFAREVQGADPYILGLMITGFALSPLLCGIPLGRLADRIGRKRVLFLISPLFWASNLLLIGGTGPGFLLAAGFLQGFFSVNTVITQSMCFELVPAGHMGRWLGIVRFSRMLFSAGAAYMAGVIWDHLGPSYLFLIYILLDLSIRIPLLAGMPDTWKGRKGG